MMLGFMVTSSNMYRHVSDDVSLQMQSQVVMAQIREYVVDCNGTVSFSGGTLAISNIAADGSTVPHVFSRDIADSAHMLYNGDLLATNVADFTALPDVRPNGTVSSITINLTLTKNGKTYRGEQVIALRNEYVTP
jgi:hypothetical protein